MINIENKALKLFPIKIVKLSLTCEHDFNLIPRNAYIDGFNVGLKEAMKIIKKTTKTNNNE